MIYENISRLCAEKGINICTLERELGIGNGAIGKWKNPERSPRMKAVQRVANYFGVTVDDLLRTDETRDST